MMRGTGTLTETEGRRVLAVVSRRSWIGGSERAKTLSRGRAKKFERNGPLQVDRSSQPLLPPFLRSSEGGFANSLDS